MIELIDFMMQHFLQGIILIMLTKLVDTQIQVPHFKTITKHRKIVSEYDQEIPQSQTADNPLAPRGRAAQPSRDTRKTI